MHRVRNLNPAYDVSTRREKLHRTSGSRDAPRAAVAAVLRSEDAAAAAAVTAISSGPGTSKTFEGLASITQKMNWPQSGQDGRPVEASTSLQATSWNPISTSSNFLATYHK